VDNVLVPDGPFNDEVRRQVCSQLLGRPCDQIAPAAGRTAPRIVRETLRLNGADEDSLDDLTAKAGPLFAAAMEERRATILAAGRVPGSGEALMGVRLRGDSHQALVSSDVQDAATVKVTAFEIERFLDGIEMGGFGSDSEDYDALVDASRAKFQAKHGAGYQLPRTVVVGWTPEDVTAAIKADAGIVAVAGEPGREQDLRAAGAEHVLANLSDTAAVLAAIYAA
jgi:phosphoglycolate phosphatase-like HAD superfamily hydrolase